MFNSASGANLLGAFLGKEDAQVRFTVLAEAK